MSDYAHAIVDAYAINKNLPINVNATNLFRNIFKVYLVNSVVRGHCLIYGSLNQKEEIDYNNHSVPYDYIISSTKIQDINYYGYEWYDMTNAITDNNITHQNIDAKYKSIINLNNIIYISNSEYNSYRSWIAHILSVLKNYEN